MKGANEVDSSFESLQISDGDDCHSDESKTDQEGVTAVNGSRTSTHTFILYLTDCDSGGETCLLRQLPGRRFTLTEQENVIASVQPQAGRLLVFPHACPHSGAEVTCVPKLLLRGEMI